MKKINILILSCISISLKILPAAPAATTTMDAKHSAAAGTARPTALVTANGTGHHLVPASSSASSITTVMPAASSQPSTALATAAAAAATPAAQGWLGRATGALSTAGSKLKSFGGAAVDAAAAATSVRTINKVELDGATLDALAAFPTAVGDAAVTALNGAAKASPAIFAGPINLVRATGQEARYTAALATVGARAVLAEGGDQTRQAMVQAGKTAVTVITAVDNAVANAAGAAAVAANDVIAHAALGVGYAAARTGNEVKGVIAAGADHTDNTIQRAAVASIGVGGAFGGLSLIYKGIEKIVNSTKSTIPTDQQQKARKRGIQMIGAGIAMTVGGLLLIRYNKNIATRRSSLTPPGTQLGLPPLPSLPSGHPALAPLLSGNPGAQNALPSKSAS